MAQNYTYQENNNTNHKRRYILMAFGVLIILSLILLLYRTFGPQAPTNEPGDEVSRFTTIAPNQVATVFPKAVKNIYWLDNNELAYTYYDGNSKGTIVAKTDGTTETILSDTLRILFGEFYWSVQNNLIILELTSPTKTYLRMNTGEIEQLALNGFAYSWSPDGDELFYTTFSDQGQYVPFFYNLISKDSTPLSGTFPPFTNSLWSPNRKSIVLYKKALGDSLTSANIYDFDSKVLTPIENSSFYSPLWSPNGNSLAYMTDEGLYVKSGNQAGRLLYKVTSSVQTTTFTWVNNQNILLIDSSPTETKTLNISLSSGATEKILQNIDLSPDQRIEVALNLNKNMIALATEKDGLLFIQLQ